MNNLITDVEGVLVGNAQDAKLASGVTAILFETPVAASVAIHGGAPGVRDAALLEPEMAVPAIDALVLSGGSAFGLDAMGGVQAVLRAQGRGFRIRDIVIPIVPGAILFDLANGGDKNWNVKPPYWDLGFAAAETAGEVFALGTAGAGAGATTALLKGGLGSASAVTSTGYTIGAIVAVNAVGSPLIGKGPHFWAAPYEIGGEFGGLGLPAPWPADALFLHLKGDQPENTTIAVVATDAVLDKAQLKRIAVMAQDGLALSLRPAHAQLDGDLVFAASTARHSRPPDLRDLTELGAVAATVLARAIARGVYEAKALPFANALPSWRDSFESPETQPE
jgi:D-aminopeptidase